MSKEKSLQMPALGRIASIGDLYDARTESFIPGVSAFHDLDETKDITKWKKTFVDVNYDASDKYSDKLKLFNIKGSLSISAAAGMIKGSGSAEFVNNSNESFRDSHFIMNYTLHTEHHQISDLKTVVDKIYKPKDEPNIWKFEPTHVLVGITWGAGFAVECKYDNKNNEDKFQIKAKFDLEIGKGSVTVKGAASGGYTTKDTQTDDKFTFTAKCDVYDISRKLPKDFQDVKDLALGLPKFVANVNDGKGVPMVFHLMSYEHLKEFLKDSPDGKAAAEIQDHIINGCLQKLEHATSLIQRLNDLYSDMISNLQIFTGAEEKRFSMDLNKLKNALDKIKGEFGEKFVEVKKATKPEPQTLVVFLEYKLEKEMLCDEKSYYVFAYDLLESWRKEIRHKIDLVEIFKRREIPFLGSDKSFHNMMTERLDEMVAFFIFPSYKEIGNASSNYLEKINDFIKACTKLREINEKMPYFVVDGTLHEDALRQYGNAIDTHYIDCGKKSEKEEWDEKLDGLVDKKRQEEEEKRQKAMEEEKKKQEEEKSDDVEDEDENESEDESESED